MLRLINFSRNCGGNIVRGLKEDNAKTGPKAPQFLFWFNENPGSYTPNKHPFLPALVEQSCLSTYSKPVYELKTQRSIDYNYHKDQNVCEDGATTYDFLRALYFGAYIAVGYNLFHEKKILEVFQQRVLKLSDIFHPYCPVLAVKRNKSAFAQPPERIYEKEGKSSYSCDYPLAIEKETDSNRFDCTSTSDYSSTLQSECEESGNFFTEDEMALIKLNDSIPGEMEVLKSVQLLKSGNCQGLQQLINNSKLGCASSKFYLGQVFEHGIFVPKNITKASKLYKEAADCGHTESMYNLGIFYLHGKGICEESYEKGRHLISKAASRGLEEAQAVLSNKEPKGDEKKIDFIEIDQLFSIAQTLEENKLNDYHDQFFALELYRLASSNGHSKAERRYMKLSEALSGLK